MDWGLMHCVKRIFIFTLPKDSKFCLRFGHFLVCLDTFAGWLDEKLKISYHREQIIILGGYAYLDNKWCFRIHSFVHQRNS